MRFEPAAHITLRLYDQVSPRRRGHPVRSVIGSGARPYVLQRQACDGVVRPALAAFSEDCSAGRASSEEGEPWSTVEKSSSIDASKDRHAVVVADCGRDGEVGFHGEIESDDASVRRLVRKLERSGARLRFCYEAGPTGYGLERLIEGLGHECAVIAPSLIPRRPGERVKTNRRDEVKLARLFRAGELIEIWTPDETHEAMRDLVRAREAAVQGPHTQASGDPLVPAAPGLHCPRCRMVRVWECRSGRVMCSI